MKAAESAAVVTGAADGIGAAVALRLAQTYALVVVNYRISESSARSVVNRIESSGGAAIAVRADVAEDSGVARLFDAVDGAGYGLGLVVNNAGATGGFATVDTVKGDQVDASIRSCLRTTVLCTREAAARMSGGSSIINISSTAARTTGATEWVHYAAAKSAVNTYTRGSAIELASRQIRVNAVAPGLVESEIHVRNGDPDRPSRLAATIPVGRVGQPSEVADAVAFLASSEATYITGHILEVSGGR